METRLSQHLQDIAIQLEFSKTKLPPVLKLRVAALILRLMDHRKKFGLFVIVGWQRKWQKYLDISDSHQDIFVGHHIDIMHIGPGEHHERDVRATVDFDGAVLIDRRGVIIHSGVFIEGLRPKIIAEKLNPGRFRDLSEQFGFETNVHARHLAAITASYVFKGTTVFTVSEENDTFHMFEGGRIIYHT